MLDFEQGFIDVLRAAVEALPADSAKFHRWREESSPYLYFEIIPNSDKAATIRGEIASRDAITLVVGEGQRELLGSGHLLHGKTIQQEVSEICGAVFKGHIDETYRVDNAGHKVRVDTYVTINGRRFNFGWTALSGLLGKTQAIDKQYQPYEKAIASSASPVG